MEITAFGWLIIGVVISFVLNGMMSRNKEEQILSDMLNIMQQYPPDSDVTKAFNQLKRYILEG
jgi:hypothetical protein